MVKNPTAMQEMQETWVRALSAVDSLKGVMNGNPLQNSCLGNPKDRRALWATWSHRVRQN